MKFTSKEATKKIIEGVFIPSLKVIKSEEDKKTIRKFIKANYSK